MQENSRIRKFSFSSLITSHCFYRRAEHVAATSRFHVIYNYWPANSIIMMQEHHRPELYAEPRITGLSLNDNHLLTWWRQCALSLPCIVSFLSRSKRLNFPAEERARGKRIGDSKESVKFSPGF